MEFIQVKNLISVIIMDDKDHRRHNKRCVRDEDFEEEPEYYSFSDNYDYGDVDYEQDNE